MLSLGNTDTNNCVLYLENYLDCVENLPDDLQKHLSRMRELDVSYQGKCMFNFLVHFIMLYLLLYLKFPIGAYLSSKIYYFS